MKSTVIALLASLLTAGLTYSLTRTPAAALITDSDRAAEREAHAATAAAARSRIAADALQNWKIRHDVRKARISELQAALTQKSAEKQEAEDTLSFCRINFPDQKSRHASDEKHILFIGNQLDTICTELSELLTTEQKDPQPETRP